MSAEVIQSRDVPSPETTNPGLGQSGSERPLGLVAELTYTCPLHCGYCSNPTQFPPGDELTTDEWSRVLSQAAELGVMHALFSGGEPLARHDLPALVSAARREGLYTNLITSAVGLSAGVASSLKDAGLDSVQISFQSDEPELADEIAGTRAYALKLRAAATVAGLGLPLTVNVVLHRRNIDRLDRIIALAERLGAQRLELANAQYYGWANLNRDALLPSPEQIESAGRVAEKARARLAGKMLVIYVSPDWFAGRPKPCMNGWGRRYLTVNPVGDVLPCPTAFEIPGMRFDNVRSRDLGWVWRSSEAFNRFRGTAWMPEPCRSCDQREIDFGGCRCQAALLTGDAANADPACELSPHHAAVASATGAREAHATRDLPLTVLRSTRGIP